MGRQYFLHRMALGRSAYEPGDAIVPTIEEDPPAEGHYTQQYDTKGNPYNPAISAFNKSMRDAQNEALLLTGIVERKERTDRQEQIALSASRSHRQALLANEHETGELLEYLLVPMSFFSHIWMEAFIKRIQIGAYPPSLSLLSILVAETQALARPGQSIRLSLAKRFPALGDTLSQFFLRIPLVVTAEQVIGRIQTYVQSLRLSRKTNQRLYTAISVAFEATLILIDLALLPMEFYTTAQSLSLIPALPLFPGREFFLPTGPTSFHAFGWTRTSASLFASSPAVLLCMNRLLRSETKEEGFPISSFFTSFKWPDITDDPALVLKPAVSKDPLGWAMYQAWSARMSILQWTGWRIVKLNPRVSADADLENDALFDESNQLVPSTRIHRSTELAHAPAQFLANAIDSAFRKIAFLPFESLMLRSVAFACTGSSASRLGVRLYAPFAGPISRLGKPGGLAEVSAYASRLGLGIVLNASLDVVLFFGVCKLVRRLGVERYDWGKRNDLEESRERMLEGI